MLCSETSETCRTIQVEREAVKVSANPANASAAQMRQIQRKDTQLSRRMLKERKAKRELGDAKQAVKSQSTAMLRREVVPCHMLKAADKFVCR